MIFLLELFSPDPLSGPTTKKKTFYVYTNNFFLMAGPQEGAGVKPPSH